MGRTVSYRRHSRRTFSGCHIEKPGTAAVAGSRILALEKAVKSLKTVPKEESFCMRPILPCRKDCLWFDTWNSYARHDLAIISFMLLVSCAQNKGELLMSSETSSDECRAAQTSF